MIHIKTSTVTIFRFIRGRENGIPRKEGLELDGMWKDRALGEIIIEGYIKK